MKKIVALILTIAICMAAFTGCSTEAERVSYNVSNEADNFNVVRQITVVNLRTDTILFQMTGRASIEREDGYLTVLAEVEKGVYKKHIIRVPDECAYVMEDVSGAYTNPYYYELTFLPSFGIYKPDLNKAPEGEN